MEYTFRCQACDVISDLRFSPRDLPQLKAEGTQCPSCSGHAVYVFNPQGVSLAFVGDAWADKNHREKSYRKSRSAYMASYEKANSFSPKLVPNYKGERTSSWAEARDEARADGKADFTYDAHVTKERQV